MEDIKWLFRKYGIVILILIFVISTGIIIKEQRKKQEFQAEECLISDEEKGELQKNVLSAVTLVSNIYKETIIPEEQKNVIGGDTISR